MKCKFCGCTERKPCRIPMVFGADPLDPADDDYPQIAQPDVIAEFTTPCHWMMENVCSAPLCVEKAYAEAELLADQLQFFIERGELFSHV